MFKALLEGFGVSVLIFVLTLVFALPLGLLIAFGRMSKIAVVRWIFQIYISIMRGTPLMLQLLICFFGPYYIFGMTLHSNYRFTAVIIAFALNYAAYFAEIYRSGIESISVGQYEAAKVLGYTPVQTFFRIIFPQVFKRILPPLTNEAITLVKDTSLKRAFSPPQGTTFIGNRAIRKKEGCCKLSFATAPILLLPVCFIPDKTSDFLFL